MKNEILKACLHENSFRPKMSVNLISVAIAMQFLSYYVNSIAVFFPYFYFMNSINLYGGDY